MRQLLDGPGHRGPKRWAPALWIDEPKTEIFDTKPEKQESKMSADGDFIGAPWSDENECQDGIRIEPFGVSDRRDTSKAKQPILNHKPHPSGCIRPPRFKTLCGVNGSDRVKFGTVLVARLPVRETPGTDVGTFVMLPTQDVWNRPSPESPRL